MKAKLVKESLHEGRTRMENLQDRINKKTYGPEMLPEKAVEELYKWYIDKDDDPLLKIEVYPDPQVEGTYAVRLTRSYRGKPEVVELLWNKGDYDEVDFETWPPKSGDLKFF